MDSGQLPGKVGVEEGARRGVPTQLIILALVAILVIPGILFSGFLLIRYAESERARYELEGLSVARSVSAVIDRHTTGLLTTLQSVSTSALLARGDFEGFYYQASQVKKFIDADIGLRLPDGRQLVNTRVPWEEKLEASPLAVDAQALESDQPVISDVII